MESSMKKLFVACVMSVILTMLVLPGCGYQLSPPPAGTSMAIRAETAPWAFGDIEGKRLQSDHYRIYTTSRNPTLLDYLPGFMEAARDQYLVLTGLTPKAAVRSMPIYMLATRPQWAVVTREVARPNHKVYLSIENGGFCFRGVCVFWDMHHPATFSIAAHEGLHQFLHYQLRDRLPAWTEEGLCTLAEGMTLSGSSVRFDPSRNASRLLDLRRALAGKRYIPLAELLGSDAGDHVTKRLSEGPEYYGHLWALLSFIRSDEVANAGLQKMLSDAAAGRLRSTMNVPPAMRHDRSYNRSVAVPIFKHYIDADLPAFEERFRAYADRLAKLE